jgi:hypothetical protein
VSLRPQVVSAFRRNLAFTAFALAAACLPAAAQGNGHANASGHYKSTVTASTHDASSHPPTIAGTGVRNFGSWLDDATVQDPGDAFVSFGFGFYKTPVFREIDAPSIDSGFGVTSRLQFGMSVPYYYATVPGDPTAHGFGDMYLSAKYQLRAPSTTKTGVAVIPMLEVLSVTPLTGSRVQFALPVSVERQFSHWRAMGSGGWFSRGAVFGAGAAEMELSDKTWLTTGVSWSYSTHHDDLSTALGLHRGRLDASGGVTRAVRPDVAIYVNVGRTLSARDDNSASFIFSAGVSFGLKRPLQ